MNQNHNENKEVHSKSLIYCTGIGHCPSTDHSYIKATHHEWNNSKEEKGHRKIANKARPQYFTDKHDAIWSKYYVLHISNHVYELVKSTKNVFYSSRKRQNVKKIIGL